jgi:uncharacterized membrane protein YraQ (UPF0718 family)
MFEAFKKALLGFLSMTPLLLGTVGLVGLMQAYITPDMLHYLFGHGDIVDTLLATIAGGLSVGQGVVSYVIAGELKDQGVSLFALSAFILSWVTLGVAQLPAEASVLGVRFTVLRNVITFFATLLVSYFTVVTLELLL